MRTVLALRLAILAVALLGCAHSVIDAPDAHSAPVIVTEQQAQAVAPGARHYLCDDGARAAERIVCAETSLASMAALSRHPIVARAGLRTAKVMATVFRAVRLIDPDVRAVFDWAFAEVESQITCPYPYPVAQISNCEWRDGALRENAR